MNFIVKYSQEKDINNYIHSVWHFSYQKYGREGMEEKLLKYFPEEFKAQIRKAKTKEEATQIIKNYLDNLPQSFKDQTPVLAVGIEKVLNDHKLEIVDLLESVYQNKFPFNTITVFLTTLGICPYDYEEKWFMSRRSNSIEGHLNTTKHELNHFMFYFYYLEKLIKDGLSNEKIEILKEAFAIFTNPEGNNKPDVKELEVFIQSQQDRTINQIIELCLESGLL
jgi:hypothetical protein